MKKICIICPYEYPIPAIRGGAIEQIVEGLCNVNEKERMLDITVLCTYDKEAEKYYTNYVYTNFIGFKKSIADDFLFFIFRVIKKIFKLYIPVSFRIIKIRKWIKVNQQKFDFFIFEDGLSYMLSYLFKGINKDKVISHLHWTGDPNLDSNNYFSLLLPVSNFVGLNWREKTFDKNLPMYVLKNGIDLHKFSIRLSEDQKKVFRQELGIKDNSFVILYIGRIVKEKGVMELIQAIELLNDPDITLLVIGSAQFGQKSMTNYEKKINKKIFEMQNTVIQLGFIHNTDLYQYQNISNISVIPTMCEEAAGLVAIEHMAAGLPLIATNSGGLPEYVDEGCSLIIDKGTNMVSNLSNAIRFLKINEDIRKQMSCNALVAAEKNSLEHTYQQFVDILEGG